MTLFTEVFPVLAAAVPKLFAWRLDLPAGDYSTVGGKLAYRLRGRWVGTGFVRPYGACVKADGETGGGAAGILWPSCSSAALMIL
jgi:hypothetical protein